jgi:RNA polymerase sigma-70 factor, ECF subfamily
MSIQDSSVNVSLPSDEELVALAQSGSLEAFGQLYERFLPMVYARVRFKIPTSDVDDVTQEVFVAVMKSLGSFRSNSKLSTWIQTITHRKIVDYYRARHTPVVEQDDALDTMMTKHNVEQYRDTLSTTDDVLSVQAALNQLPQHYQDILLMRMVDDLPFQEIARLNGQTLEATKSLFRRSLSALAKKMEEDEAHA